MEGMKGTFCSSAFLSTAALAKALEEALLRVGVDLPLAAGAVAASLKASEMAKEERQTASAEEGREETSLVDRGESRGT
jgi:ribosomal protein L12E/L44/L45/RPP1/RPP2